MADERRPLLSVEQLDLLNGLAHDAWSGTHPLPAEHQRQLGELAVRAWAELMDRRVLLAQVTDLLANAAPEEALAWLEQASLGYPQAVEVLSRATDLDRLRDVAEAVAGLDPISDGLRCIFCGGATEENWYADGQGLAQYATSELQQRLVRVPADGVSHYDWWHEPNCLWVWAWRLRSVAQ